MFVNIPISNSQTQRMEMQGLDLLSDNYVSGKQRSCASRYLTGAIICANASMFQACPILHWTRSTQCTPTISVSSVCQEPVFIYRYDVSYDCTVLWCMNFHYHWHIKIPQTLAYSKMNSRIYAKKVQSILLKWWNAKHTLNKPPVLKFLLYVSHSELKLEPNKILQIARAYYNCAEFHAAAVFQVSFIKALSITALFLSFFFICSHWSITQCAY